ncbi:MAG: TadE family type IV pilus minor pilin [Nocardioidaceae bacterium]
MRSRAGRGMVTAEAALVLPLVALFALALVWLVSVGIDQVRVVDAARDAARALARGDGDAAASQAARRTAGSGAVVVIRRNSSVVSVTVSQRASAPDWLLVPLPAVLVTSQSSVEVEGDGDGS